MKILTLIFFMLSTALLAQPKLSLSIGYGTYSMKEVKEFDKYVPLYNVAAMSAVSAYPPYVNYEGGFVYQTAKSFIWGVRIEYGSSGARVDYRDYSGSVRLDQIAKYVSLSGSVGMTRKYPSRNMTLVFDVRPGVTRTDLEMVFRYNVGSDQGGETNEFRSLNFVVQPTASLERRFGRFGINVYAGVHLTIVKGNLRNRENKDEHLMTGGGDSLRAGWTGLRGGFGVSWYIKNEE
jgi:hypothetical protein